MRLTQLSKPNDACMFASLTYGLTFNSESTRYVKLDPTLVDSPLSVISDRRMWCRLQLRRAGKSSLSPGPNLSILLAERQKTRLRNALHLQNLQVLALT